MRSTVRALGRQLLTGLVVLALPGALWTSPTKAAAPRVEQALKPGEAIVWYLGHCGYAVKTATKFLVFDYSRHLQRRGEPPMQPPPHPTLANGWIDPEEIKGLDVVVFVTHSHADHYDEVVRSWARTVGKIQYVLGWDAGAGPGPSVHSLKGSRAELRLDGLDIYTVFSHHDDVDESAFLVKVDGLAIYHNGDYIGKSQCRFPIDHRGGHALPDDEGGEGGCGLRAGDRVRLHTADRQRARARSHLPDSPGARSIEIRGVRIADSRGRYRGAGVLPQGARRPGRSSSRDDSTAALILDFGCGSSSTASAHRTTTRTLPMLWIAVGSFASPLRCDVARRVTTYVPGLAKVTVRSTSTIGSGCATATLAS